MLEVVGNELEGVAKSSDGGKADLKVGLFLAGTLYNCRQDGVGVANQGSPQIGVLALADDVQQILPLVAGQLNGSNRRDDLSSSLTGLRVGRG
ncbi:hypothetical protein VDGD_21457 [Verticillium dahliae]|nr:hypothetical protein VDGD_21457 [Verticillium dahliae]